MNDDIKNVENLNNERNAESGKLAEENAKNSDNGAENLDVKTEKITEGMPEKHSYNFVNVSDEDGKIPEKSVKKEGKNNFVLLCLLFAVLTSLLFTPAFNIKSVVVTGNNALTAQQLVKSSGIVTGRNILRTNTRAAVKNLKKMPLINDVHIMLKFPATVEIAVEECVKTAYVKHLDKYICIDKNGKILEILNGAENENLIVVTGVVPTKFEVGAKITLKDSEKFDILTSLLSEISAAADLPNAVKSVDLSDKNRIKMTMDNEIVVNMGKNDALQYKMAYLTKTLETQLKTYRGGTLDLSDPSAAARYKGSAQ